MARVTLSIVPEDIDHIQAQLNKLIQCGDNLEPVLASIGEYLILSHRARFDTEISPDGTPWTPLSDTTKALKTKNQDKILRLNDHLGRELNYRVWGHSLFFGTPYEYGAMHHFGGTTSPRSMMPNKAIPARPWLGVDEDDAVEIYHILSQHLMQE